MATKAPDGQIEISLMVWNPEAKDGMGAFQEQENKIGFFPSISKFELEVKGLEITDVNCYPGLSRVVIFAHRKDAQ